MRSTRSSPLRSTRATAAAALFLAISAVTASPVGSTRDLTPDGVWSWFSDPRAIYHAGTVYSGWVTRDGHIQVGAHDTFSDRTVIFDLERYFEPDDHDYPALYATSDGRLTAFYAMHAHTGVKTQLRVTDEPWDITKWSAVTSTGVNTPGLGGTTYSNPYTIPGEIDEIFLFWRGGNWKPNYCTGSYDPSDSSWSWTEAQSLIMVDSGRPYVKYDAYEDEKIGLAFTSCHPEEGDSNLYFATIGRTDEGENAYFRSDGTFVKLMSEGPLSTSEADLVFDGYSPYEGFTDAWIWDTAFDDDGLPVMVYATFPSRTQHTYHWARFDGETWQSRVILEDAGGSVADTTIGNPQYSYSGGVALDHGNEGVVYVSHENEFGGWDLERWKTSDAGASWTISPITAGSTVDNLRPVVPINRPKDTDMVLWLSGTYDFYANFGSERWWPEDSRDYNYDTAVRMWVDHTDVSDDAVTLDVACALGPPTPNPFSRSTEIPFDMFTLTRARMDIYDVAGRKIITLLDRDDLPPGRHSVSWNGNDRNGSPVGSGVYCVLLTTDMTVATGKVVLSR